MATSEPDELTLVAVAVKCAPEVDADAVPAASARLTAATTATSAIEGFLISDTMFPSSVSAAPNPEQEVDRSEMVVARGYVAQSGA